MHKKKRRASGSKVGGTGGNSTAGGSGGRGKGASSHNFCSATISSPAPGGAPPSGVRQVPPGEPTQDELSDSYDPAHGGWGPW